MMGEDEKYDLYLIDYKGNKFKMPEGYEMQEFQSTIPIVENPKLKTIYVATLFPIFFSTTKN